ncbi:sigma-54 interaction domain-containing protein [Siminovitchia sediminis]|uniref:Sigma-54 interaction domain-containing protein n=1 Tax=Siminovitchia sediminis TaxID=1274353 RepID=A0ABW4KLU7_9BACI
MARISYIQEFIDACVNDIAEMLGQDVTILDENGIRISGTGYFNDLIGKPVPEGSFFKKILQTGKPGLVYDMKKSDSQCISCKFRTQCRELATIGFPILKRNKPVGVIGVVSFSAKQKKRMIDDHEKLIRFLSHLSTLLENKLILLELTKHAECEMKENIPHQPDKILFSSIIGYHSSLKDVVHKAQRVANSISTVLIRGESGTGKKVLAKAIHNESKRSKFPFVAVNCAAIPENLLESELFGYESGAFTGAKRGGNIGKFELAHKGTIFLDEIGDMSPLLQAKLLRVLQERTINRVGGNRSISIDCRVIAATNRNLEEMMKEGTFREDLYYRINVIPLTLKPLKERREDIGNFIELFIRKFCNELNKRPMRVDPELKNWLIQYNWPGNIRQLENAIEYMVNMAETEVIGFSDIPDYLLNQEDPMNNQRGFSLEERIFEYEKNILQRYFLNEEYRNNKVLIASELQISLATLYRKLEKYKLVTK